MRSAGASGAAQSNLDGPTEYRDCWLGSPSLYDECVQANNWGADFGADDGTNAYRDCWLGNWEQYSDCVDANTWGVRFLYPDPDGVSLIVGGIPSY